MRHRRLPLWIGALALLAATGIPAGAVADDRMTFDARLSHPYLGFGVNLFVPAARRELRDAVMRELHVRFVRVSVFQPVPDAELQGHPSVAQIGDRIAAHEDPSEIGRLGRFGDEMRDLGIGIHLVFRHLPPAWTIKTGTRNGHDERQIDPARIEDCAAWITAQLLYAGRHGITPQAVELIGEPDGAWNTEFTPEQYDALLVDTRTAMDRAGLTRIGIDGPATSKIWTAGPYLQELARSLHIRLLANVSMHDYDTVRFPEPAGLGALPVGLVPALGGRPLFVTEFSSLSPRWTAPPYDADPEHQGGSNPATGSPDFAVAAAAEAIRLLGDGANAVFYWELEDHNWQALSMGLLDLQGHERPALAAFRSFLPLIPADAQTIPPGGLPAGMAATAFVTPAGPLFVFANTAGQPRQVSVRLAGFPAPIQALTEVGRFPPQAPPSYAPVRDGAAVLTIPANAVVALRGQSRRTAGPAMESGLR